MERSEIYKVLDAEREYQDQRWGGEDHDRNHEIASWILYMEHYLTQAREIATMNGDETLALHKLRGVVALGIACFEVHGLPKR